MWRLQAADDQRLVGGFGEFPGDRAYVVDLQDALDLSERALDEVEVAAWCGPVRALPAEAPHRSGRSMPGWAVSLGRRIWRIFWRMCRVGDWSFEA